MKTMNNEGFAVVGSVVIIALAVFMGFSAAVVVQRGHLLHQVRLTQQRGARAAHESLKLVVDRKSNSTDITLVNQGSTPSVADALLLKSPGGSLEARQELGGRGDIIPVEIIGQENFTIENENIGDSVAGVHTRLGNVFWEEVP